MQISWNKFVNRKFQYVRSKGICSKCSENIRDPMAAQQTVKKKFVKRAFILGEFDSIRRFFFSKNFKCGWCCIRISAVLARGSGGYSQVLGRAANYQWFGTSDNHLPEMRWTQRISETLHVADSLQEGKLLKCEARPKAHHNDSSHFLFSVASCHRMQV